MERKSARVYIREHNLCKGVDRVSGIYAITINDRIVYIGQAINMESRTRGHIRNIINEYNKPKYKLLLDANNRGYRFDCREVIRCSEEELDAMEDAYIKAEYRPLNKSKSYFMSPRELTIKDLLAFVDSPVSGKVKVAIRSKTPREERFQLKKSYNNKVRVNK